MRTRFLRRVLMTMVMGAILSLAGVTALYAQATDGIIVGTVVDPAGAPIPNAKVTATNQSTGVKYAVTTNETGEYRINNVPVGTYELETTTSGMSPAKLAGVVVELNRTTTGNFKMTIASASTIVEVAEATPLIDTSTAQLQNTFKS